MRENNVEDFSKMFKVTDACLYDCCTYATYVLMSVRLWNFKDGGS